MLPRFADFIVRLSPAVISVGEDVDDLRQSYVYLQKYVKNVYMLSAFFSFYLRNSGKITVRQLVLTKFFYFSSSRSFAQSFNYILNKGR